MRHRNKINHLEGRTAHRTSILANMACSLIEHKRINTTLAKAKALRILVEPPVAESKNDTTHNRRVASSKLHDKYVVAELSKEVATKVGNRPDGHTRIIELDNRLGDNVEIILIEFVDYNTIYNTTKVAKKKTTRRGRRKATAEEVIQPIQATEAAIE